MKNVDFRNGRPLVMMVSQYDFGYNLQVALWSNGTPVTITAAEIVSENFTVACTFSGNVVTMPIGTSMTERFGHFPAELRVTDSTGQVSSKNFDFFVERSPLAVKSTETYSGDIVEFTAKSVPLSSVVVTMEPIQSLNGYDAPWPAGGGKNKLPPLDGRTASGITFTANADGSITASGTATANAYTAQTSVTLPAGTYILNGCPSGGGSSKYRLYINGGANDYGSGAEFTLSAETTLNVAIRIDNGQTVNNLVFYPMIRLATETDDTYEPYSNICPITGRTGASVLVNSEYSETGATTYPITFTSAGTVYAGTVDLVSGRLVVTHKMVTVDGSKTVTDRISNQDRIYFQQTDMLSRMWSDNDPNVMTNSIPLRQGGDDSSKAIVLVGRSDAGNGKYIYVEHLSKLGITTFAQWTAYVTECPLQITYPLETPITYTLTPTQVMSLLGENVVWSPDGEVEVVVPEFYS